MMNKWQSLAIGFFFSRISKYSKMLLWWELHSYVTILNTESKKLNVWNMDYTLLVFFELHVGYIVIVCIYSWYTSM